MSLCSFLLRDSLHPSSNVHLGCSELICYMYWPAKRALKGRGERGGEGGIGKRK